MTSPSPSRPVLPADFPGRVILNELGEPVSVEVDETSGNAFHLGPVLRKYTASRLVIKGAKRSTIVELGTLYDALGLLRSLQYDVDQFNSAAAHASASPAPSLSETRYACYRLTRQASAFGVRVPRPGAGTVAVAGLDALVAYVEATHTDTIMRARALLAGGLVDFAALAECYTPGTDVLDRGAATGVFGVPTAMRVRACFLSRGKSLFGVVSTFYLALELVIAVSDRFAVVEHHFPIADFPGTRSTSEGLDSFITLREGVKAELVARGALYERCVAAPGAFMEYAPGSFLPVPRGGTSRAPARARGGGRIMVDLRAAWSRGVHAARSEGTASDAVKGVLKLVAQRARSAGAAGGVFDAHAAGGPTADGAAQAAAIEEEASLELLLLSAPLPRGLLHLTWPVVAGFSFAAKSWGVAMVAGLRAVTFNEDAFVRLVLPPERKRLIEALVLSHAGGGGGGGSVDLIAGKGEGAIFLLHGPPGCGKTLTAEAIAELLHRPLYVVSMGELGTSPEALEERLLDVLDLCTPWGALVLIDEAEMLLERRSKNDIVRNAMVCVMLRLLEYYSGILFLTTNRVESLDPAFQSRVQVALRYDALGPDERRRVWEDLIAHVPAAHAPELSVDTAALAAHELNGRQIKNALQLALALARAEGAKLDMRHIDATVQLTTAFVAEGSGGGV